MKTSCSSLSFVRLLALAFVIALGLSVTHANAGTSAEPVATVAAKDDGKGKKAKFAAPANGAKGNAAKTAPPQQSAKVSPAKTEAEKKAKAAPANTGAKKGTAKKGTAKKEPAKQGAAQTKKAATASKADNKDKSKKALSAKPATKPAPKALADTNMDAFDAQAEDADETSSSPLLLVFVLFVAASVGGFYYLKKKQIAPGIAPKPDAFTSNHGEAFASDLSSLDSDKKRTQTRAPIAGSKSGKDSGPEGSAPSGISDLGSKPKNGWRSSKLFGMFSGSSVTKQLRSRNLPFGSFGGSDDMTTTHAKPMKGAKQGGKKAS